MEMAADVESSVDEFDMGNDCMRMLEIEYDSISDEENSDHCTKHDADNDDGGDIFSSKKSRIVSLTDEEDDRNRKREIIEENNYGVWYNVMHDRFPPSTISFKSKKSGHRVPGSAEEPLDFFRLFFTDELIEDIASETNKYADNRIAFSELRPNSTWQNWKPVNKEEMKAFIGVVLNMGVVGMPKMQDYWCQEFNMNIPFFTHTFRRQRFMQIFWMLHLNEDVVDQTPKSKTQNIDNFLTYIGSKFQRYYTPRQNLTVGESVIDPRGKISFVTHKTTPCKWGVRIYLLADSSNGYVYSILPYYLNITDESLTRPDLPASARIVLRLFTSLLNRIPKAEGYSIYCDKYYTSLPLADELLKLKTHLTGTINPNRKNTPDFIKKPHFTDLKRTLACRANNTTLLAWKQKRVVTTISTIHNSDSCQTTRKLDDGKIETVVRPRVVSSYAKNMNGIKLLNQSASSYCFLRGALKSWRKLFFFGLEICSLNSYALYKDKMLAENKPPMTREKFVSTLVNQLVGDFKQNCVHSGRLSSLNDNDRLDGRTHFIMKSAKKKDCIVCSKRKEIGGRRETVFICETCRRKPGLHPGVCFKRYHTMKNFKM